MSQKNYTLKEAKHLYELVESDPETAIQRLEDILLMLVTSDTEIRRYASDAILKLSADLPLQLRNHIGKILPRLDDTDYGVRTNTLLALSNLAHWYPQDLAPGAELMVDSLTAERQEEQLAAATVLVRLGYYRPDIVPRRAEVISNVERMLANNAFDSGSMYADREQAEQGLLGLEGGDLASRPLEADLAPPGNRAQLSSPARIGITVVLWPVFFFLGWVFFLWWGLRFSIRYWRASVGYRASRMIGYLSHLRFLANYNRAKLYLRRTWVPTLAGLLPWAPGTTPQKSKPSADVPPYPENWHIISSLVKERDGYTCRNCGTSPTQNEAVELHADHQVPRSQNGPDFPSNIRTLCRRCHEARHAREFE